MTLFSKAKSKLVCQQNDPSDNCNHALQFFLYMFSRFITLNS